VDRQRRVSPIEEDEIEREAHAEGVDAGAARNQQAGACPAPREPGKAEEARVEAIRQRHFDATNPDSGQPPEPWRELLVVHLGSSRADVELSPARPAQPNIQGATRRSGTATHRHAATMIGMIRDLSPHLPRGTMGFNCG